MLKKKLRFKENYVYTSVSVEWVEGTGVLVYGETEGGHQIA